ncbi:amino acid ABC transporter permease [Paraburkholderia nemoris]|jgi:amine acid ABC transporter, permease protein, 3-TM region, His/Glu/Gln/Arg/opine family|uniref:amino acid ABC transporter permease n=1 Tax=Paraburkholderia nemoris TaxID=2793076 RepID=UPI001AFDC969|nr:amino acid ABC transporter permease [Paraburkholderia nemoris]CAE6851187.1 Arginine transport system permease protein ArtQ [Paraburkholderia nemoris]
MFSSVHQLLSGSYLHQFQTGMLITVELFVLCWVVGMALGIALTVLRAASVTVGTWIVSAFVAYHRSVPTIVQILVWYFGVPQLLPDTWQQFINDHNAQFMFAAIALSLNSAAYISEDLRSGFRTLPHTQQEAARALGLTYLQSMRLVIVPQAIRAAMPALVGQTLSLFKTTSLAMAIGVAEVMYIARQIEGETYATFGCYLIATAIYLVGTSLIAVGGGAIQRNLQHSTQR